MDAILTHFLFKKINDMQANSNVLFAKGVDNMLNPQMGFGEFRLTLPVIFAALGNEANEN